MLTQVTYVSGGVGMNIQLPNKFFYSDGWKRLAYVEDGILYIEGDVNYEGQRHGIGKCTTPHYVLIVQWKNDKFSGWGSNEQSTLRP